MLSVICHLGNTIFFKYFITLIELCIKCPTNFFCRSLAEMAAATSVHVVAVIEPIIQHADWFFPGGKFLP